MPSNGQEFFRSKFAYGGACRNGDLSNDDTVPVLPQKHQSWSWLCSCSAWLWKIVTRHPGLLISVYLNTLDVYLNPKTVFVSRKSCRLPVEGYSSNKVMVPSLQLQCLYSVAGRLEEYSSTTLSLLPTSLRRQLLLCLPIVDICTLERDESFMIAIDPNEVWSKIQIGKAALRIEHMERIICHDSGMFSRRHDTIKDVLLTKIAHTFLAKYTRGHSLLKLLACYLYGISEDMHAVALASCREQTPVVTNDDSHLQWAVPQRYISEVKSASIAELWRRFFNSCQWFPTTMKLDYCFCKSASQYGFFSATLATCGRRQSFF